MSYCIWLTGLSGSGKTTLARRLAERQDLIHLDGDVLRGTVCQDLGFSSEDRDENIYRVITIASYLVHTGQSVVCSFISPYAAARMEAALRIPNMQLVWVACPLEVCEARDPKGLYAKVRAGEMKNFTGIDAPYQAPSAARLMLATDILSIDACIDKIEAMIRELA